MATDHPKAGPNSIPAYQLSGVPYVTASAGNEVPINTGSPVKLEFPYVTRFFQIENIDDDAVLRVGFSSLGVKGTYTKNYFTIATGQKSDVLELRTKDLWFLSDHGSNLGTFRVSAGLTTIDRDEFPTLTGSFGGSSAFEGVG